MEPDDLKKIEERFLNDQSIDPVRRINYLAARNMDVPLIAVSFAATVAFGGIAVATEVFRQNEVDAYDTALRSVPDAIYDLNERVSANSTDPVDVKASLRRAAGDVLRAQAQPGQTTTLVFERSGNVVTMTTPYSTREASVPPRELATAFRQNLSNARAATDDGYGQLRNISGLVSAFMGVMGLQMVRMRRSRIDAMMGRAPD